eukprot:PITA_18459
MDERESATAFVARIKDVKDGLGAIGVAVADEDLVAITMNGMRDDFQTFIPGVSAREKTPMFDDLTAILQQEEDRRQNLNLNPQSDDLALVEKRRLSKGKQSQQQSKQKGGTSQKNPHSHKGMLANHYEKKCYYCGKTGHIQRDCYYKKQADEARRRQVNPKHRGYFVEEEDFSHEFRLFTVDCALSASNEDDIWYVDSGASSHMTGNKEIFDSLEEIINGSKIYLGDDNGYQIKGHGAISVKLPNGKISHLSNVLYVPGIKKNLISVSMMADQDMHVEFFKTHCVIKDCRNEIVATGMRVGSLYRLDAKRISKKAMVAGESTAEQLWHQRFGHLNLQDLMLLQKKGMVEGLPIFHNIQLNCDGCALGKMHREQFHVHDRRRQTEILELVHTDQYTVPHTPQQNGVAERKNKTLVECARSMLQGKGLSNIFWAEAINTDVYLKNRSPTRFLGFKTPFEALYGFKPAVNHLRVFGSKAFAHVPKADRKKLDPKAVKCIFVGYGTEFKAYKLFNPESRKTFASRDVVFHEQVQERKADVGDDWHIPLLLEESSEDEREQVQEQKEENEEEQQEGEKASPVIVEENKFEVSPLPRRSGRKTQLPLKLRNYALMSKVLNIVEPSNYKEASQFKEWRAAMNEEMESILRNDTWDLVGCLRIKHP